MREFAGGSLPDEFHDPADGGKASRHLARIAELRTHSNVAFDARTRAWQVFGLTEAVSVLADPAAFSSDFSGLLPSAEETRLSLRGNLVGLDPPRHRELRKLAGSALTARAIGALAPRIADLTARLLGPGDARARFDVLADLAQPLSVTVIAELLGIPAEEIVLVERWADALMSLESEEDVLPDTATIRSTRPWVENMSIYLMNQIADRRAFPTDDLISRLVTAESDGRHLDDDEIIGFTALLLLAGHITTTMLIGNTVLALDEHPEVAAELRADPALVPAAIEEMLRLRTPQLHVERRVTRPVTLDGHTLQAGDLVVVWLASANRDGRAFPDPERFDLHRTSNQHLSFGHGIHYCLGAPLAKLEAEAVIRELVGRYSSIRVAPGEPVEFHDPRAWNAVKRLTVETVP